MTPFDPSNNFPTQHILYFISPWILTHSICLVLMLQCAYLECSILKALLVALLCHSFLCNRWYPWAYLNYLEQFPTTMLTKITTSSILVVFFHSMFVALGKSEISPMHGIIIWVRVLGQGRYHALLSPCHHGLTSKPTLAICVFTLARQYLLIMAYMYSGPD